MKKLYLIFILIIFSGCTTINESVFVKNKKDLQKKIRIAILPLDDSTVKKGAGLIIADSIANELVKITNWDLVERSQLKKIMDEKSLNYSGVVDVDINKIGQLSKTDYIIIGSVSGFSYDRRFYIIPKSKLAYKMRIIDTKTGVVIGTIKYNLESGKHAWMGLLCLNIYYVPVALFTEENINTFVDDSAESIVEEIKEKITISRSCL